ncbi:unnamed protein product [Trichogramma brassicae]|uniref:Reverse transcriptase domain-containing protein n=1 Tax=Trichogramma brassicae TaxID=86971 RepID=A0A6H5J6C9_9HYME|nr:unnamed protein product [Trichogramma brassicae]
MHDVEHAIYTKDDVPVNAKPCRFPQPLREELERQLTEMLKSGIIEESKSSYRSNIFLVPKAPDSKGNKKYRLVVDYRQLNEKTEPDRYPLPNILDIIDHVGKTTDIKKYARERDWRSQGILKTMRRMRPVYYWKKPAGADDGQEARRAELDGACPALVAADASSHNGEGDYDENNRRSFALQGKGCQTPVSRGIRDRDRGGQSLSSWTDLYRTWQVHRKQVQPT